MTLVYSAIDLHNVIAADNRTESKSSGKVVYKQTSFYDNCGGIMIPDTP